MGILLSWLVLSAAVWITAAILPRMRVTGIGGALLVGALFGLLNFFLGWLLFFVIGIGTLGIGFFLAFLTRWVVNTVLLKVTDAMTHRLTIDTWGTAFIAAALIAAIGTLGEYLLHLAF